MQEDVEAGGARLDKVKGDKLKSLQSALRIYGGTDAPHIRVLGEGAFGGGSGARAIARDHLATPTTASHLYAAFGQCRREFGESDDRQHKLAVPPRAAFPWLTATAALFPPSKAATVARLVDHSIRAVIIRPTHALHEPTRLWRAGRAEMEPDDKAIGRVGRYLIEPPVEARARTFPKA